MGLLQLVKVYACMVTQPNAFFFIKLCFDIFFVVFSEDQCKEAFMMFNGRWYAGRQLQCEFSPVTKWKMAICGKNYEI